MIPQYILLTINLILIGCHITRHNLGESKDDQFVGLLVVYAVLHALLWWGGFYAPLFR